MALANISENGIVDWYSARETEIPPACSCSATHPAALYPQSI